MNFTNQAKRLYYPEELLNKFKAYTQWVEENPLNRYSLIQKTGETVAVPLPRPMSIKAFSLYAGISATSLAGYAKLPEYQEVIEIIKTSVYVNKYEGAACGLFSSAIMIRDLGLSDSVVHILDDSRKSIAELFPSIEEITAIEVSSTTQNEIDQLNLPEYTEPHETDQQKLHILDADLLESKPADTVKLRSLHEKTRELEKRSNPGGKLEEREDFFLR